VVPLVPLNPSGEGAEDLDLVAVRALRREVRQLRDELQALRLWCLGLEQQQAQLAVVLSLATPVAGRGLTRFPVGAVASTREKGTPLGWTEQPRWPSG